MTKIHETIKIEDLDKLKFTSIKYGGDVIHFKYDDIDYVVECSGEEGCSYILRGRDKYKCDVLASWYGSIKTQDILKYQFHRRDLSSIDKWYFVKYLIKLGVVEPTAEQKQKYIQEELAQIEKERTKKVDALYDFFNSKEGL